MRGAEHSDFANTHGSRRWTKSLPELFRTLKQEAEASSYGGWSWYILRHGALVAVRRTEQGRLELRISRRDRPADGGKRFDIECKTFEREFGVEEWPHEEVRVAGIGRRYTQPTVRQEALL